MMLLFFFENKAATDKDAVLKSKRLDSKGSCLKRFSLPEKKRACK
jgi:hypothetical protein